MTKQATTKPAAKKTTKKTAAAKTTKATRTRTVVVVNADKPKEKRPEGRPSSYKPEYAELCFKFALLGASDARMAELLGVAESTFHLWKTQHPEFSESINAGKEEADAKVAASLYHRAIGYSHKEDDIRTVALGNNMGSEIVITPTEKHYPPDTQAASLWLRNRQPKLWRDKVDVSHQNPDGSPLDLNLKVSFVTPKGQ